MNDEMIESMTTEEIQAKFKAANEFVSENLSYLCRELNEKQNCSMIDWRPFEKIPLTMLLVEMLAFTGHVRFSLAENLVKTAAVNHIAEYGTDTEGG